METFGDRKTHYVMVVLCLTELVLHCQGKARHHNEVIKVMEYKPQKCRPGEQYRQDLSNGRTGCRACSVCLKSEIVLRKCKRSRDTVCAQSPPEGSYVVLTRNRNASEWRHMPCSKCPSGQGAVKRCRQQRDTVCQRCQAGTYSTSVSHTDRCVQCGDCRGRGAVWPCGPANNVVCGKCEPGFYWDSRINYCVECSDCSSLRYGVPYRMSECNVEGQPESHRCLQK